jgi:hypothetical protein
VLEELSFYKGFAGYPFYGWFIATRGTCFDTPRMLFLIIPIIIVLDFNVYSLLTHVDSAFQVSPAMKVT